MSTFLLVIIALAAAVVALPGAVGIQVRQALRSTLRGIGETFDRHYDAHPSKTRRVLVVIAFAGIAFYCLWQEAEDRKIITSCASS